MSKVKFEQGDCDNEDIDADEKLDVCIKSGPIVTIFQLILQVIFAIYFSIIYYMRGQTRRAKKYDTTITNTDRRSPSE